MANGRIRFLQRTATRAACGSSLLLGLVACSSGQDDTTGGGDGGGQVTSEWQSYCVATFVQDYTVVDVFGDTLFHVKAGSEYLVLDYSEWSGEPEATLAYLSAAGPYDFDVATTGAPFTSNCDLENATGYYAAFTDVTVYQDEALTTPLCELTAGTAEPLDGSSMAGSSLVMTDDIDLNGPSTYEIYLNSFSARCGGADTGFVSVPETRVLGVYTWLVPIQVVLGPS